ncbi:MAG: transcription termination/antitermination protein NusG [Gemmataceae bacterium]
MPILPPETNCYPHSLFLSPDDGLRAKRSWWVLHTKPRQEKKLAQQMLNAEVPFYLPLIAKRNLVRGRAVHSYLPLFCGYVFLLADERERIVSLATKRVVNCLRVGDQTQMWNDLDQVQRLIASGAPITPEERLQAGSPVEICHGPLAGLRGTILRTASGRRFVVQVDFIQRGASVLLDQFSLAPVAAEEVLV